MFILMLCIPFLFIEGIRQGHVKSMPICVLLSFTSLVINRVSSTHILILQYISEVSTTWDFEYAPQGLRFETH
jgi:hypothetical protein